MIRALIVDDEPLAREGVRMLLAEDAEVTVIGECSNGREAVISIIERAPDLIFLDVQMPEMSGFEVLEEVGIDKMPVVIFVTAYDKYALQAFEVHALDYLLKPFTKERFLKALVRAKAHIRRRADVGPKLLALLEEMKIAEKYLERLVVKSAGRVFFLEVEEIDWIEAAENYVRLHVGRDSHLVHGTMNGLEARLDPDRFLRIHRSAIINLKRVKELRPLFHGEYVVILQDDTQLTSSRSYREKLQALLNNSF
jgi:two-component system LytT family response regulator